MQLDVPYSKYFVPTTLKVAHYAQLLGWTEQVSQILGDEILAKVLGTAFLLQKNYVKGATSWKRMVLGTNTLLEIGCIKPSETSQYCRHCFSYSFHSNSASFERC